MKLRTLVLSNGVAGAEKQAVALAEAVGLPWSKELVSSAGDRSKFSSLPTRLQLIGHSWCGHSPVPALPSARLHEFPALAISCGRGTIPASLALKHASNGQTVTVHVQRPDCDPSLFDLVVAPRHDFAGTTASNVLLTSGALHSINRGTLQAARQVWKSEMELLPAPRLAVLIGGKVTRRWWQRPLSPDLTPNAGRALMASAAAAVGNAGGSLLVTTSRRTASATCDAIREELSRPRDPALPHRAWAPDDSPNPYLGLLGWADSILVTADSVSMVSEACGTGKPVYVHRPHECSRRFRAFHEHFLAMGYTHEWQGRLEAPSKWAALRDSGADRQFGTATGRGGRALQDHLQAPHSPAVPDEVSNDTARAATRVREIIHNRQGGQGQGHR